MNQIGEVISAGNSNSSINYSFSDISLAVRATSYYRLLQVDFDGLSKTYGPLSSNCETIKAFELVIAPNPNNGKFKLNIYSDRSQEILIQIKNSEGKEISS